MDGLALFELCELDGGRYSSSPPSAVESELSVDTLSYSLSVFPYASTSMLDSSGGYSPSEIGDRVNILISEGCIATTGVERCVGVALEYPEFDLIKCQRAI